MKILECDAASELRLLGDCKIESAIMMRCKSRKGEIAVKPISLGEIIAERYFEAKDETGREREIIVRVGKPIPDSHPNANGDWCCPFEIVGFADHQMDAAFGVDSMQAIVLCLQKIIIKLNNQQKTEKIKLTWQGSGNLNLTVMGEEEFNESFISEMIAIRDSRFPSDG